MQFGVWQRRYKSPIIKTFDSEFLPYNLDDYSIFGEVLMTDRKLRVFLCHTLQDKAVARELYDLLETEEWIDPWLADEKLIPGMDWGTQIEKAVGEADAIIVCLSKNAITGNKQVQRELRFVLQVAGEIVNRSIFIIPLKLDGCQIPRHVQPWQYYDFSVPQKREQVYKRLLRSLERRANLDNISSAPNKSAHIVSLPATTDIPSSAPHAPNEFSFMEIPKGKFQMGSRAANHLSVDDEIPQHPCYIPYDYWISRFPITNEQFGEFAVSNKRMDVLLPDWKTRLRQPAVNVSWHSAVTYVHWLNKVYGRELSRGQVFRLPTEAEWERAARGDAGREWPWGNESLDQLIDREISYMTNSSIDEPDDDDFYGSNDVSDFFARVFKFDEKDVYKVNHAATPETEIHWKFKAKRNYAELKTMIASLRKTGQLVDVGCFSTFTDSPYKVGDMMGSITEWTQSLYAPYPYDPQDGRECLGGDERRVLKGFFATGRERFSVRSARRFCAVPNTKDQLLGFRVVIAPPVTAL